MATPVTRKDESILIVGAGTFGLSAALELAQNGYTDITVLDKAPDIPSTHSAGSDLNKVIRAEYGDQFYTGLALDAIQTWKSPFFAPFYVETGLVMANSKEDEGSRAALSKFFHFVENHSGFPAGSVKQIESGQDLRQIAPKLQGNMEGWFGYFNSYAGYAQAGKIMEKMYQASKDLGVRFVLGQDKGCAQSLLWDGKRCIGVKTKSDDEHKASRTILALGAHIARLLPSISPQVIAKAWSVAHLQLSPEQASRLAGIPVINCRDLGFFFEPDTDTGLIKLCAWDAGITNYEDLVDGSVASVPISSSQDESFAKIEGKIPRRDEEKIKKLISATMTELSSLPITKTYTSWCADTSDSNYIIDYAPEAEAGSLLLLSGDSGHAFKMLPIAGRWAREVLESGEQKLEQWKWKQPKVRDADDTVRGAGAAGLRREASEIEDWVGDDS